MKYSNNNHGAFTFDIYRDTLYKVGFKSGENVYAISVAGGDVCEYSFYMDVATGKPVYTGFSPIHSEVKSFVLP